MLVLLFLTLEELLLKQTFFHRRQSHLELGRHVSYCTSNICLLRKMLSTKALKWIIIRWLSKLTNTTYAFLTTEKESKFVYRDWGIILFRSFQRDNFKCFKSCYVLWGESEKSTNRVTLHVGSSPGEPWRCTPAPPSCLPCSPCMRCLHPQPGIQAYSLRHHWIYSLLSTVLFCRYYVDNRNTWDC